MKAVVPFSTQYFFPAVVSALILTNGCRTTSQNATSSELAQSDDHDLNLVIQVNGQAARDFVDALRDAGVPGAREDASEDGAIFPVTRYGADSVNCSRPVVPQPHARCTIQVEGDMLFSPIWPIADRLYQAMSNLGADYVRTGPGGTHPVGVSQTRAASIYCQKAEPPADWVWCGMTVQGDAVEGSAIKLTGLRAQNLGDRLARVGFPLGTKVAKGVCTNGTTAFGDEVYTCSLFLDESAQTSVDLLTDDARGIYQLLQQGGGKVYIDTSTGNEIHGIDFHNLRCTIDRCTGSNGLN